MTRRAALLIGTGSFNQTTHIKPLVTPRQNVIDFASVLRSAGQFLASDIQQYIDKTKAEIDRAITGFFADAQADDILVLYYSGHGLKDDQGNLFYLATSDSDGRPDFHEATAVSARFITRRIDLCASRKVVIILDCCYSASFTEGAMSVSTSYVDPQQSFGGNGGRRVVLTASDSHQPAWELPNDAHSIYTQFLIAALQPPFEADSNNDGKITIDELHNFLVEKVSERVPRQKPQRLFALDNEDEIVFATNPMPTDIPKWLKDMIRHEEPEVRRSAVNRLASRLGNERLHEKVLAELRKLSGDSDNTVQQAALDALGEENPPTRQLQVVVQPQATEGLRSDYLHWIIEEHSQLRLQAIPEAGVLPSISLETVYVALRVDRTSQFERMQTQELLEMELLAEASRESSTYDQLEMSHLRATFFRGNPSAITLQERDRTPFQGKMPVSMTLDEAVRYERALVILGDPGSGKTTLARWLTLKFARAMNKNPSGRVRVKTGEVNPDEIGEDAIIADLPVDLGPARMPILIRVASYAEAFMQALEAGRHLPLHEFLGQITWDGRPPTDGVRPLPPVQLGQLFEQELQAGRAFVVLDGMDEITGRRSAIADEIVRFINVWIYRQGRPKAKRQVTQIADEYLLGDPVSIGGNQVVITSRIVGYYSSPLRGNLTHVLVEPMRPPAVRHFCRVWTTAVHRLLADPSSSEEQIIRTAEADAQRLINAIFNDSHPFIADLARNPLMVTILALVYRSNHNQLPQTRAELYQTAMERLIECWRTVEGLTSHEIFYVLSPVAAHIHDRYATGLITERELSAIILEHLARYHEIPNPLRPPPKFNQRVSQFITVLSEQVGLLAARGERVYGFLHLTFQEYLAAGYLVRDREHAPRMLIERIDNPRWREAIKLALGIVTLPRSQHIWGDDRAVEELLTALLAADPADSALPRSALLIVAALPDMDKVPAQIVRDLTRRLLQALSNRERIEDYPDLQEQIIRAMTQLRAGPYTRLVDEVLVESMITPPAKQPELALAAARMVRLQGWLGDRIVYGLIHGRQNDSPTWSWPFDAALRAIVTPARASDSTAPQPPEHPNARYGEQQMKLEQHLSIIDSGELARRLDQHIAAAKEDIAQQEKRELLRVLEARREMQQAHHAMLVDARHTLANLLALLAGTEVDVRIRQLVAALQLRSHSQGSEEDSQ